MASETEHMVSSRTATPAPTGQVALAVLADLLCRYGSERLLDTRPLAPTTLSRLLWEAAGGAGRKPQAAPLAGPGAVDIHVACAWGLARFDACHLVLLPSGCEDVRGLISAYDQLPIAPVNLIYSARLGVRGQDEAATLAAMKVLVAFENVFRYCGGAGLQTVARGWLDRERLARALGLAADESVLLVQSVGFAAVRPA